MRHSRVLYLSIGGFALAGALLAAAAGLSYRELRKLGESNDLVTHTLVVRERIRTLQTLLGDAETAQRGFLITGDPAYLQPYQNARRLLPEQRAQLGNLTRGDAKQLEYLIQLDPLIAAKMSEMDETIHIRELQGLEAASRIVLTDRGKRTMDRIRSLIASMLDRESQLYNQRQELSARNARLTTDFGLAGLMLALVLLVSSGLLLALQYQRLERAGDELQQSEERFRLLVEGVKDYAIFAMDTTGRVTSWNAGAERIKGYRTEEVIGRDFSCFYPREDVERGKPEKLLETAALEGQVEDEGWRVRKDGSRFWASAVITALRDPPGRLTGFSKITRDITERRRAEEEVRRRNERLALLIQNSPLGIVVVNSEGRVEMSNPAFERLFLYSASEIEGVPYDQVFPGEQSHNDWAPLVSQVLAGESVVLRARRHRKDGMAVDVDIYGVPLVEGGKFAGAYGIYQDVTERLQKERAIRDSQESLRELSSQLFRVQDEERQRIGRELHDSVGQILVMLKMGLDSLENSLPAADGLRQKLASCIRLANESIKEIRTTSYELYPPMLEEAGLKSAIPWFLDGFMERSGVMTTFEAPAASERPARDVELAIFRVLQESLTNVRRHSGSPSASVRLEITDGILRLEVADQGKGIPPEVLEAFDRESLGKLGVGLRGMKERIRQLGGKLEVCSTGKGTTVSATVPWRKP